VNFVADERVDRQIVEQLREDGHPVIYVSEMDPGIPGEDVLRLANHESAILITADKDFGELVFRQALATLHMEFFSSDWLGFLSHARRKCSLLL